MAGTHGERDRLARLLIECEEAMKEAARRAFHDYNPKFEESALGDGAEDAVQNVHLRILQKGLPRHVRNPRKYVVKAAYNEAVDRVRRARFDQPLPNLNTTRYRLLSPPLPLGHRRTTSPEE